MRGFLFARIENEEIICLLVVLFSFTQKNDPDGVDHDFEIQGQRNIFNINDVVLHSIYHFINVFGITKFYHSPACNAWLYFKQ